MVLLAINIAIMKFSIVQSSTMLRKKDKITSQTRQYKNRDVSEVDGIILVRSYG